MRSMEMLLLRVEALGENTQEWFKFAGELTITKEKGPLIRRMFTLHPHFHETTYLINETLGPILSLLATVTDTLTRRRN